MTRTPPPVASDAACAERSAASALAVAPRSISTPAGILTTNPAEVVNDPNIDIVAELIGGYEPAKELILAAIARGKHVVTANKALLAAHGAEIDDAARRAGITIGFEASVGGGIPRAHAPILSCA